MKPIGTLKNIPSDIKSVMTKSGIVQHMATNGTTMDSRVYVFKTKGAGDNAAWKELINLEKSVGPVHTIAYKRRWEEREGLMEGHHICIWTFMGKNPTVPAVNSNNMKKGIFTDQYFDDDQPGKARPFPNNVHYRDLVDMQLSFAEDADIYAFVDA